ncbi:aldehyde-activating protein [Haematobacter missouriensis]|uniref:Aldehyde-activating protein n=1 Tax=Haematobacter missouriensis TaxID=366616 RepID=A0A225D9S2_9RHOB|nr:aldehyde-activating protein [Haematobacter missouriensis]OWJ85121.1 aldehyde-activating protein [Haematobacter missouriensis]
MAGVRTGRCLCGAVQISIRNAPVALGACHCENCRRWTGSALIGLTVAPEDIAIVGSDSVTAYRSSDWATRSFCSVCGSTLWYRLTVPTPEEGSYEIPVGLLDNPHGLPLTSEIYIDRKPDGYVLAGATRQQTAAEFEAFIQASMKE